MALVDFAITFVASLIDDGLLFWYGFVPNWQIVFLPAFIAAGRGRQPRGRRSGSTALNVQVPRLPLIIPFLLQFGLYVSPVGFSSAVIPQTWRLLTASIRSSA